MERPNKEFISLSLCVSEVEFALHEYTYAPQLGLDRLQITLLSFQENAQLESLPKAFHLRLILLLDTVNRLLILGAPYLPHYHVAFLSATDALFQVAIGSQFGRDRIKQLSPLLSIDRPCWAALSLVEEKFTSIYSKYEARLQSIDDKADSITVDSYLKSLSAVGRVSFCLDSIKLSYLEGRFSLISVQSLSWLKARFPALDWRVEVEGDESLRRLCEFSFLPLFQHDSMGANFRHSLLELLENKSTRNFYIRFEALFGSDSVILREGDRLVPKLDGARLIDIKGKYKNEVCVSPSCFPLRHGGFFYAGLMSQQEKRSKIIYVERLGQDFLSSFLYEIKTTNSYFVFDQQECLGCYSVFASEIVTVNDEFWFKSNRCVDAKVPPSMIEPFLDEGVFPADEVLELLVVEQAGEYFALPYLSIRELEGVCSVMPSPRLWVKNIWLDRLNEPLMEPWLISCSRLPEVYLPAETARLIRMPKSGYYSGKVGEVIFWIEASLVLEVAPYKTPISVVGNNCVEPFIIHEGRSFDRLSSEENISPLKCNASEQYAFSAILEWGGESLVLSFGSCEWHASLPENTDSTLMPSEVVDLGGEIRHLPALQTRIVIDKTNFLSFVDDFQSSAFFFKSDD